MDFNAVGPIARRAFTPVNVHQPKAHDAVLPNADVPNATQFPSHFATDSGISSVPIFCEAKSITTKRTKILPDGRSNFRGTRSGRCKNCATSCGLTVNFPVFCMWLNIFPSPV